MTDSTIYRNPQVGIAVTAADKQKCADVRVQVFVNELGYPSELESLDTLDSVATLWLATCEKVSEGNENNIAIMPVGTIRMLPYESDSTVGVLSRLAVVSEARGMQLGQKLVQAFERGAREAGKKAIMVQGVAEKRSFYEALGYTVEIDETYIKDGSPHYKFWKRNL